MTGRDVVGGADEDARADDGRPRLTRAAILAAALEVIDEGGVEACTMRAVAHELGVEAMSLYWHVANKEALLDGVIEMVMAEVEVEHLADGGWRESLAGFAITFRRVVLRHANVINLLTARPLGAYAAAGRMIEASLAHLEAGGFDRQTAIRAARSIARYAVGFTLAEGGALRTPPLPTGSPAVRRAARPARSRRSRRALHLRSRGDARRLRRAAQTGMTRLPRPCGMTVSCRPNSSSV